MREGTEPAESLSGVLDREESTLPQPPRHPILQYLTSLGVMESACERMLHISLLTSLHWDLGLVPPASAQLLLGAAARGIPAAHSSARVFQGYLTNAVAEVDVAVFQGGDPVLLATASCSGDADRPASAGAGPRKNPPRRVVLLFVNDLAM